MAVGRAGSTGSAVPGGTARGSGSRRSTSGLCHRRAGRCRLLP